MAQDYHHGVRVVEVNEGSGNACGGSTSASAQPTSNGIQTKSTCEICQRTVSDPL